MNERRLLVVGSLTMFVGVAAGAFGAHGLKSSVSPEMLSVWETGVTYQLIHAIGLLLIGLLMPRLGKAGLSQAGNWMFVGVILFSGSLYLLTLTGIRQIGVITPIGGLAFLAAWLRLAHAAWRGTPP